MIDMRDGNSPRRHGMSLQEHQNLLSKDLLVIRVLIQEFKDLHQTLNVPKKQRRS